jgi:hypothetical protein
MIKDFINFYCIEMSSFSVQRCLLEMILSNSLTYLIDLSLLTSFFICINFRFDLIWVKIWSILSTSGEVFAYTSAASICHFEFLSSGLAARVLGIVPSPMLL